MHKCPHTFTKGWRKCFLTSLRIDMMYCYSTVGELVASQESNDDSEMRKLLVEFNRQQLMTHVLSCLGRFRMVSYSLAKGSFIVCTERPQSGVCAGRIWIWESLMLPFLCSSRFPRTGKENYVTRYIWNSGPSPHIRPKCLILLNWEPRKDAPWSLITPTPRSKTL